MRRLALAVLLWTGVASAQGYPHVACYAATKGGGAFVLNNDGSVNPGVAKALAKFQLVTMNLTPWFDFRPGVIDTVRAYHTGPEKMKIFAYDGYGQRFAFATTGAIWTDLWNLVNDGGTGLLYDTGGNYYVYANPPASPWPNLSRPEIVRGIDSLWINRVVATGKCDGLFLDTINGICNGNSDNSLPNDYARAGYATAALRDSARCRNLVTSAYRLRDAAGHLPLIANGSLADTNASRATWNGIMNEGYPVQFITPAENTLNQHLHNGPFAWAATYSATLDGLSANNGQEYNAANTKQMRFGLGSACMGSGWASFTATRNLPASGASYLEWWYDEYSVNTLSGVADTSGAHTGWMGNPLGPPVRIWPGVYYRVFEHGLVVLNCSGATYSVPLGDTHRRWKRITGVRETTINNGKDDGAPSVADRDAIFLVPAVYGQ
jgi:hypothetical protein